MPDDDPSSPGPEGPEPEGGTEPAGSSTPSGGEGGAEALAAAIERPRVDSAVELLEKRARLTEARLEEVLAAYRQLKTENEGHRDRVTRNLERRFDQRRERLLLKFIDILDNLDRALEAAEATYAGEPLIEGLILVRTQLLQTLQEEGLERIPVLGLAYDPNFSEAVGTQPVTDPEHHHVVVKELMRGYRLNGRIARASRVVIGECAGAGVPEAPAAAPVAEAGTRPPSATDNEATVTPQEGMSLEEIISRAQAQEALFPSAFETKEDEKKR